MADTATRQPPTGWSLTQPMDPGEFAALRSGLHHLVQDHMKRGVHYGTLTNEQGRGDERMILKKSGAELILQYFQFGQHYALKATDLPNGHREYHVRCKLTNHRGELVAEGLGSCSTMEAKYRFRKAQRLCPKCGKAAIINGKEEYGGGWLCWKKKDGCGAKFAPDDPSIVKQQSGRVENANISDEFNTALKMAKKRAMVDAAITGAAAGDLFTQDVDDDAPPGDEPPMDAPRNEPPPRQQAQRQQPPRQQPPRQQPSNGARTNGIGSGKSQGAGDRYRDLRAEARELCRAGGAASAFWQDVAEQMGFGRDGKAVAAAPPDRLEAFVNALRERASDN